jgi:hypothetical protein
MNYVGIEMPAKDEILTIDKDTKNIIAPFGYNNVFCNYGDVGVTELHFLINRYIDKKHTFDIYDDSTLVNIHVTINGLFGIDNDKNNIVKTLYNKATLEERDSLVLITWKVPAGVTAGAGGPNDLQIMLSFENTNNDVTKRWYSNIYDRLKIGRNLFEAGFDVTEKWQLADEMLQEAIENYFATSGNFIIDANE